MREGSVDLLRVCRKPKSAFALSGACILSEQRLTQHSVQMKGDKAEQERANAEKAREQDRLAGLIELGDPLAPPKGADLALLVGKGSRDISLPHSLSTHASAMLQHQSIREAQPYLFQRPYRVISLTILFSLMTSGRFSVLTRPRLPTRPRCLFYNATNRVHDLHRRARRRERFRGRGVCEAGNRHPQTGLSPSLCTPGSVASC